MKQVVHNKIDMKSKWVNAPEETGDRENERSLQGAGHGDGSGEMGRVRRETVVGIMVTIAYLVLVACGAAVLFPGSGERLVTLFLIHVIAVTGIGVYSGNSGIISFGNVGFMAIGAYVSGILTIDPIIQKTALPHLPEWLAGGGMSFLPAMLIAA